ncbi:MAG: hypothetical protein LLF92_09555 [Planctomycetaceae bacterium]|nr:hypothetical protein [Planctomycetaceae bacterium]
MKDYILELISDFIDDYNDCSPAKKRAIRIIAILIPCFLLIGLIRSCSSGHSMPKSEQQKIGLLDLARKDAQGDKWELDLVKGQPISGLNVDAGFGPLLVVRTNAELKEANGEILIGVVVTGRGGEKYVGGVRRNGQWQKPPDFKIVDSAGKVLDSGSFKYG